MNNKINLITDSSRVEKCNKMKKKSKKNQRTVKPAEYTSDHICSAVGPSKSDMNDPVASCQSTKEDLNSDEVPNKGISLPSTYSQYAFDEYRPSTDLHVHNGKVGICPKGSNMSNDCTTSGSRCSNICTYNVMTQPDAVNHAHHHHYIWRRKVKSHFVWRKIQTNAWEAQMGGEKKSHYDDVKEDVSLQQENILAMHNLSSGEGLLPASMISSSGHSGVACAIKKMANTEPQMHRAFHSKVFVESSERVPENRLNGHYSQYFSQSNQAASWETKDCGKSRLKSHYPFACVNNCSSRRSLRGYGENFFRLHSKAGSSQRVSHLIPCQLHHYNNGYAAQRTSYGSQPVVTHSSYHLNSSSAASAHVRQNITRLRVAGHDGFQPCNRMKIPWINHMIGGPFRVAGAGVRHSGLKLYNECKPGHYISNGTKDFRWVPVSTKDSGMLENTCSTQNCNSYDISQFSCNEVTNSHLKGICVPTTSSDCKSSTLISSDKITSIESKASECETSFTGHKVDGAKEDMAYGKRPRDSLLIGSQVVIESLRAAYKLQVVSQRIQLAMGHPLADFERFLQSATPISASSYVYEAGAVCFDNQFSNSPLCKHQIPDITLHSFWGWYEKPGNYGLEVKGEDSRNLKSLHAAPISFHAYFVPFLSAVQLFGQPHLLNSCANCQGHVNHEGQVESDSSSHRTMFFSNCVDTVALGHLWVEDTKLSSKFDSVDEPVCSSKFLQGNGGGSVSATSSHACSGDPELLFEFFESELPQQRKPLHIKIMELITAEASNQLHGDPLKLESLNLHDLHPASWFSVAWYPIYRIPEGNFRASFLTYHSLGHLYGKCIPSDSLNKMYHIVYFPVIGLQSYNTQGECWFDLRIPLGFSSKEITAFGSSEILRERLKTLEENALLLSRGCVSRDKVNVVNQHPDYEFFISRKH